MKNLVLSDKIYSTKTQEKEISVRYLKYLNEISKGFSNTSIKIKKLRKNAIKIRILGNHDNQIISTIFNSLISRSM